MPGKAHQLGASPSWWPAGVGRMVKEIGKERRCGGAGKYGHVSSGKMLNLSFARDTYFDYQLLTCIRMDGIM